MTHARDYNEDMRTSVVAVCVLAASSAYADELVQDPAASPGFTILLRQDAVSRAGGELTYFFIDGRDDMVMLRFDLHGHYVDPSSGLGGYAQVPISFLSDNTSETVLGGGEVGGIYIPKLASQEIGLVLRAGITLPTVSDEDNALIGLVASYLRPSDVFSQVPRSSTLRFSASPTLRSGTFFARLDAGLDINVYADGRDTIDPAIVLNAGAGVDLGTVAIMGEISTFALLGDEDFSLASAAVSVRSHAGPVQPYGALLIPIDKDASEPFHVGVLAGVEARL